MGRGWRRAAAAGVALGAALALQGCQQWACDFESHGACVEFTVDPPDLAETQRRMDRLLELELPYWGIANLEGWRIQYRDSADYPCYFADRNDGCTDYLERTLSLRLPPDARDCFEAAELLHELGHYELGDPMHSNAAWSGLDERFAGVVWDRPDAPAECVARFEGIRTGVWVVNRDGF